LNFAVGDAIGMKTQSDEMKCPKCGRLDLRESGQGVTCRVCGYTLSPGESDKFRLFRLLKEEEKQGKSGKGTRRVE
jgi:ribosomal protein L37AE/L43A